jgi:hypothetical protein
MKAAPVSRLTSVAHARTRGASLVDCQLCTASSRRATPARRSRDPQAHRDPRLLNGRKLRPSNTCSVSACQRLRHDVAIRRAEPNGTTWWGLSGVVPLCAGGAQWRHEPPGDLPTGSVSELPTGDTPPRAHGSGRREHRSRARGMHGVPAGHRLVTGRCQVILTKCPASCLDRDPWLLDGWQTPRRTLCSSVGA